MKSTLFSVVSLVFSLGVQATPVPTNAWSKPANSTLNPCAKLAALSNAQNASESSPESLFKVSDALACLRTVPINNTAAVQLVQYVKQYVNFQSTLSYLKSPPSTYPLPATDLLGGLDKIAIKAKSGGYQNEYDFESDIVKLGISAFDGHTNFQPYLISQFNFQTNVLLASVSQDGKQSPRVFFQSDISKPNATFNMSDVVSIDGVDVNSRLLSRAVGFQDLDALYNSQLFDPATSISNLPGYAAAPFIFSEDQHTYKFRNGTSKTLPNQAVSTLCFDGITSGQDIFNRFVNPNTTDNGMMSTMSTNMTSTPNTPTPTQQPNPAKTAQILSSVFGYPSPVAVSLDNSIGGYFLNSDPKAAILNIRAFTASQTNTTVSDFQQTISRFLKQAKAANKTRLLVDVRGNPGGELYTGFDAFKQIFPNASAPVNGRFRAQNAADIMGRLFSALPALTVQDDQTPDNVGPAREAMLLAKESPFNVHDYRKITNGANFTSWSDLFGPVPDPKGDNFTQHFTLDFNDIAEDLSQGLVVTGFGNNTNVPPQAFSTQNIVLLTDGACSSTCGIFSNLMVSQGRVKTLVLGGRPFNSSVAPKMAEIGGTQGGQDLTWDFIQGQAQLGLALLPGLGGQVFSNQTAVDNACSVLSGIAVDPPLNFNLGRSSINFKDSFVGGNSSTTPLQFQQVRPGDCRILNTAADIKAVQNTWSRIFSGNYACADGGSKF